jgi:MarR family transcriptional regulator, transcriptional regulator for hemolysin
MRQSANERFGMGLVLLARLYRREIDIALEDFGLSEATALPLRHLARSDGSCRQGDLAQLLSLEGPTLVRVLDQLVERKLVERIEDKDDRRAKTLHLTPAGRSLNDKMRRHLEPIRRPLFKGVRSADLEIAMTVLDRIVENIISARQGSDNDAASASG